MKSTISESKRKVGKGRPPPKKASEPERISANRFARLLAKGVENMPAKDRDALMDEITRDLAKWAPPVEAVGSDLFLLLLLVGRKFLATYFPDANHATFHASCYPPAGAPSWSVMIPLV
jgi:hypothetical protein